MVRMRKWIIPGLMVLAAVVMGAISYPYLPEQVAIHWNAAGEPDNFASKEFALILMPVIMIFIYALIRIVRVIDPKKQNIQKFGKDVDTITNVTLFILLIIHGVTILHGLGREINVSVIAPAVVGMLFIVIGNYMPRFKFNYFIGIRTPWTLANEKVWRKTHQIGGICFVTGGLLLLISAFLPVSWKICLLIFVLIVITGVPVYLSYNMYQKQQES